MTADPLEASTPVVELIDPSAAEARNALEQIGRGRVDDHTLEDLLLGVSAGVANARLHGVPPTTLRIWATYNRVVVRVQDRGKGPVDPLAGLVLDEGHVRDWSRPLDDTQARHRRRPHFHRGRLLAPATGRWRSGASRVVDRVITVEL